MHRTERTKTSFPKGHRRFGALGEHGVVHHIISGENHRVKIELKKIDRRKDHIVDRVANGCRNLVIQTRIGILIAENAKVEASLTGGAKRRFLNHA